MARRAKFDIARADTAPELSQTLTQRNDAGQIVNPNLTGASVVFYLYDDDGTEQFHANATVTDAEGGEVTYHWAVGDTNHTPGWYEGKWLVTFADTTVRTYPNPADNWIRITARSG